MRGRQAVELRGKHLGGASGRGENLQRPGIGCDFAGKDRHGHFGVGEEKERKGRRRIGAKAREHLARAARSHEGVLAALKVRLVDHAAGLRRKAREEEGLLIAVARVGACKAV